MNLTEFLLARIAEDEIRANAADESLGDFDRRTWRWVSGYDVGFKLSKRDGWHSVWVASDGWQFTIDTAGRQNPPWSCTPLAARVPVPESWGD